MILRRCRNVVVQIHYSILAWSTSQSTLRRFFFSSLSLSLSLSLNLKNEWWWWWVESHYWMKFMKIWWKSLLSLSLSHSVCVSCEKLEISTDRWVSHENWETVSLIIYRLSRLLRNTHTSFPPIFSLLHYLLHYLLQSSSS